ncbi:nicotinate-nucleotide-dimethylbenzimidazole phosphoribosyltransferase [Monaibacterium marinum]|uniref:Nicotinate-nucleotide--dimethylbenzimidazole phosphoribosyltransferase n=1 Tax=Pontivivens marinum TaxID=1690039 RepID=A0A2C9CM50_9RHOB|nr:nicotinate-nucleotide--dimethylbenzimidazole phosphoribosyltransferase [Monaibacterium marinum]SOH92265.1 nicotinate-nucleotide-dimethylbenzimidazole phosphoribosyltransferase [Monaibacterium marinum]
MTTTFSDLTARIAQRPAVDSGAVAAAQQRNGTLTKPPGALGRLEELAIWYAGWRGQAAPRVTSPQVIVFAGNHGVTAQGVSAFPPEVTVQMVANFQHGGAAVNQLAKDAGARMDVHAIDLDRPTADFTQGPAMSVEECAAAFITGWDTVDAEADLLVVGEMGIGNTTSAAAIATALLGGTGADWVGRGTGVDDAGLARKADAVDRGLAANSSRDPLDVLAALGGREVAAMAGAIARARCLSIPVVLDGFICCSAALVLHSIDPDAIAHCVAGHLSAEGAHARVLDAMDRPPLLDLGLRLGEASGGTLAIHIVRAALACHSGMATFAEAGVAGG